MAYLNHGKGKPKTIDPVMGPLVRRAFELYASAAHNLGTLGEETYRLGLRNRRGARLSQAGLAKLLHNTFYIGTIYIQKTKETFVGVHDPLIKKSLFDRVQSVLHGKANVKAQRHEFPFRRILSCTACGYSLIGERQKGHVYYRCHTRECSGTSIREDLIEAEATRFFHLFEFNALEREYFKARIPPDRINDVILVDPSDEQYSVGFNILSAHSDLEKTLLSSDLVSVFQRLSSSWGDQMGSVLQNAILAFLESDTGGTLAGLRRFLLEPGFRDQFLKTVRDPDIVYYWRKGFSQLSGNKSIGPVLTRLETFLSPKLIRYMVSQPVNRLDFREIIDTGKIFLAKLPQGQMGKENAFLLGSLLVSKFQQLAMSRQAQRMSARKDFWLYIDEFQNFITPSMTEILTGARKYRMGLVLAHQELRQLERDREVSSAVLSNTYTRIVFRVGDADARALESGFSFFEAKDIQNLETGQAICRVEKSDGDFNLAIPLPKDPGGDEAEATRQAVIAASRTKYAAPRAEVEAMLLAKLNLEDAEPVKPKPAPASSPKIVEAKATVSEKEDNSAVVAETVSKPTEQPPIIRDPSPPRDLGRGGAQHKAIQERLQTEARALGFFAEVESPVAGKSGPAADLVLRREDLSIAVEISVTTTTDHEFGNVKKCLGFSRVAVVSPSPARLEQIAQAVRAGLTPEQAAKVGYYVPDDFISELRNLTAEARPGPPPLPNERVSRGWKVKRRSAELSSEERQAKEKIAHQILLDAMKPKP